MANPKPHTTEQSVSERLEAARAVKDDAVIRELCWAAVGSHIWPSFLCPPQKPQPLFPWLLCLDTPAGRLVYRVADGELHMFEHLDRRPNDHVECTGGDKMARLLHLAEGPPKGKYGPTAARLIWLEC